MGVDTTARAEVMLCGVGVELVDGEQFAALSNVDAVQIRGHRNRPAHATVRTGTTPRRTKPIGQRCCKPHPAAMAGAVDRIYGGPHSRLLAEHRLCPALRIVPTACGVSKRLLPALQMSDPDLCLRHRMRFSQRIAGGRARYAMSRGRYD